MTFRIRIDLSGGPLTHHRKITINAASEAYMDKFVKNILHKMLPKQKVTELVYGRKNAKKIINHKKKAQWFRMPKYEDHPDVLRQVYIHILISADREELISNFIVKLASVSGIKPPTKRTQFFWFPEKPKSITAIRETKMYHDTMKNKYPIYVISKGRWKSRLTLKYLEWAGLDYLVVVEPQERAQYESHGTPSDRILELPISELRKAKKRGEGGGIPARNFVLNHSKRSGHKWHWILDDNIRSYKRLNMSQRVIIKGGGAFRCVEEFVDRYDNIMMAGHNYQNFVIPIGSRSSGYPPVNWNTRVYSSIMIRNDIPFKWRGRYNEDTDLSLRCLKAGYATALFNAFICDKVGTLTMTGGNTDTVYSMKDSMFQKAESLRKHHPDIVKVQMKYGRVHHQVNYRPFKGNDPDLERPPKSKRSFEFGMRLVAKDTRGIGAIKL
jgi:hypothetical protein